MSEQLDNSGPDIAAPGPQCLLDTEGHFTKHNHLPNFAYEFEDEAPFTDSSTSFSMPSAIDHPFLILPPHCLSHEDVYHDQSLQISEAVSLNVLDPQGLSQRFPVGTSAEDSKYIPSPREDNMYMHDSSPCVQEGKPTHRRADCIHVDCGDLVPIYRRGSIPKSPDPSNHPLLEDIKKAFTGELQQVFSPSSKMTGHGDLDLFMLSTLQTVIDCHQNYKFLFDSLDSMGGRILGEFQATCEHLKSDSSSVASTLSASAMHHDTSGVAHGACQPLRMHAPEYDLTCNEAEQHLFSPFTGQGIESVPCSDGKSLTQVYSQPTGNGNAYKRSSKLPEKATSVLKKWLFEHSSKPYPDDDEKQRLCLLTGLSLTQINNWFINARRRILHRNKTAKQ